jgi:hypothetical protein
LIHLRNLSIIAGLIPRGLLRKKPFPDLLRVRHSRML